MRLLLDEHYDPVIAEELRRRGVDAAAVTRDRPELGGQDDVVILRAAVEERRAVVTNDVRDYVGLVEEFGLRGEPHFGALLTSDSTFSRSKRAVGLLVDALEAFVQDAPDDDSVDSCMYLPLP